MVEYCNVAGVGIESPRGDVNSAPISLESDTGRASSIVIEWHRRQTIASENSSRAEASSRWRLVCKHAVMVEERRTCRSARNAALLGQRRRAPPGLTNPSEAPN
jgi:hypothetical protein